MTGNYPDDYAQYVNDPRHPDYVEPVPCVWCECVPCDCEPDFIEDALEH